MWQDVINLVLGIWLAASPWLIGGVTHLANSGVASTCLFSGILIGVFAAWAGLHRQETWQGRVVVLLGLWILIAPGTVRNEIPVVTWDNVVVGLAVAILGLWSIATRKKASRRS